LTLLAICAGCAALQHQARVPQPTPESTGIVFVADGAGDYRLASTNIRNVCEEDRLPLDIETYVWSHGPHHVLLDQMDGKHTHEEGLRLAALVRQTQEALPGKSISLVGHSAGCFVVLGAAEDLPPGSIERIVLLSPSVPANYDLRRALKTCRAGMDVHCSTADQLYLRVVVGVLSACKGIFVPAAGLDGFEHVPSDGPADGVLLASCRQFHWSQELTVTGNNGGHYGTYQHGYLRGYVLPALIGRPVPVQQEPPTK
jgi:pimeloyl-ACP methyl ester carboxylesterase